MSSRTRRMAPRLAVLGVSAVLTATLGSPARASAAEITVFAARAIATVSQPDISTLEAFKRARLNAKSIAYLRVVSTSRV